MAETPYFSPELPAKFLGGPARPVTLLPDIEPPSSARPAGGFDDDPGAGSIGSTIDPTAREQLGGFKDEWASFADAPAQDFSQFADGPNEFDAFASADELDARTVEDLDKDRENFRPAEYFSSNPDVARDPKKLSKLLEVYRRRDEEGLTAKGVAKAAIENTPGLVSDIAGGVKRLGERAIDLTVQPVVNVLGSVATGDIFNAKKREAFFDEAKKNITKSASEVGAGSEAATVGLVDLARTGLEKLPQSEVAFPGRFSPPGGATVPTSKKKTDQELLAQLSDDASFRQVADAAMRGEGEAAKAVGLDKETLAKQGIELDENAITQLSLVDPITMVATGGAFKLVGIGGKVLATAKTLQGAEKVAEGLSKVATVSRTAKITGGLTKAAGRVATDAGKALEGKTFGALGLASPLLTGDISGIATAAGAKYVAGPLARNTGKALTQLGKELAGNVPRSAGVQKLAEYTENVAKAGGSVAKGAAEGVAAGSPFALAANDDETAGSLLGAGAALGGVGAPVFRVVDAAARRNYFGENRPVLPDVASPGYGDVTLDALHETNIKKLSARDASEVNNFREVLRPLGKKILAVDQPTFRAKVMEAMPEATPEQINTFENHSAFFDSADTVYLNSDATGLQHDAGHLFDSLLAPEKRTELRDAVTDTFGQKAIDDFKADYERRVGSKLSDKAALDEYIAEQFAAFFNSVPITEMAAPKSLLTKFVDTLAEGAESLGFDLSEGAKTPNLGAPVSVGIRKLFENAAGDVVRRSIEAKGRGTAPAPTPSVAPPAAPASPNIRVGPADVASFKQSASPEIRAQADARARETGVEYARSEAVKDPASSQAINSISDSMESGRPVVQIEHQGITSVSTPEAPLGRIARRGEQAGGYAALEAAQLDVRENAPPEIVSQHSKNFVPVRWEAQKNGKPVLIAMSLDKVISNVLRVAADPVAKDLIPYPVENGKFTAEGWREVVSDVQKYSENQANGRKGDGGRLEVPEAGLSIPAENPAYTPQTLSPEKANFANLVMGLEPPKTSRAPKGKTPGNVKAQILAEANRRPTETPANISPKRASKQAFVEFPGRTVQEVNPLRNRLKEAGSKTVGNLIEVTEKIRAQDIKSATPRPDINFKAPVTDIIRGGFQPRTESGKALEKQGYQIKPFGELGVRGVEIFDRDNTRAGEIISEAVDKNEVGIQNVLVRPQFRGKGIGEALYRELGAQLKEDGVTLVIGDVVAPEPLALRQKVFGEFENIQVNGEPASLGDALTAANMTKKGVQRSHVEAANRITSESRFLPAPTEFRKKSLGGRTVEEFSDYILKATPEEWKAATDNMTGGLTGGAWNLGLGLKDAADVGVLKSFQAKLSEATKAAMSSGDFDAAYSLVSKGQFMREAYEAATGTGSAGAAFKRGTAGMESAKPPFPLEEKTQSTAAAGPETKPITVSEVRRKTDEDKGGFQPKAEVALPENLEIPTKDTKSEEGYIYHATNVENARSIAETSMTPEKPWFGTDQSTWPDGSTDRRSYFIGDASKAYQFAPEEGQSVLLRAKKGEEFKRESTGDYFSTKKIPSDRFEILTSTGWKPLSESRSSTTPEGGAFQPKTEAGPL